VLKEELPAMVKRYEKFVGHFGQLLDQIEEDARTSPLLASSFKVTRVNRTFATSEFLDREWAARILADPVRARWCEIICYSVERFGRATPEYTEAGKAYMDTNGNLGLRPEQKSGVIDEHAFDLLIHLMGLSDLSDADLM
jgi:hypothetical protein